MFHPVGLRTITEIKSTKCFHPYCSSKRRPQLQSGLLVFLLSSLHVTVLPLPPPPAPVATTRKASPLPHENFGDPSNSFGIAGAENLSDERSNVFMGSSSAFSLSPKIVRHIDPGVMPELPCDSASGGGKWGGGEAMPMGFMPGGGSSPGGGGATMRVIMIPMPSIPAKMSPPNIACRVADAGPWRICKKPPVSAPAMIGFQGSSFFRRATSEQSKVEKSPPQIAKLPPILGASRRIDSTPPSMRRPLGEFFIPLSR
mmetsp:Transcript_10381/g.17845  ORF Transcript_10381/g.17845 Transcript_10381/m.17845 type:complete len:257 (-) Transcript_10381:382-1152(-)